MKNTIKLLFLLFIISISSCQRCRNCSRETIYINGADLNWCRNYVINLGYEDFTDYLSTKYPRQEFCGNELREAKQWYAEGDLDGDGINDYRVTYDCSRSRSGNGPIWCLFC